MPLFPAGMRQNHIKGWFLNFLYSIYMTIFSMFSHSYLFRSKLKPMALG